LKIKKEDNKRRDIANDKSKGAKVNPKTGKVVQARPRPNKRTGPDYLDSSIGQRTTEGQQKLKERKRKVIYIRTMVFLIHQKVKLRIRKIKRSMDYSNG